MSKLHSRPKDSSFLHPEHVDGCGPRAAGEGAAGTPPPGLRPDPCPAATWGEGPRWPPRNRHPGCTRSLRRPEQPELGEGAPPRGAGEGRAGPANVSDLGAGRPPLPRCAATARGCPTEAQGGGGGAQLAAKNAPAAPRDLGKFVRAPSRHGHAQRRLRARPGPGPAPPRAVVPRSWEINHLQKAEGARPARTRAETTEDQKGSRKDGCSGSRCHQHRPPPQNHRRQTSKDAHHHRKRMAPPARGPTAQ
ncbi:hypothetical protein H8959_012480 [Pygathrix nigripes]